MKTHSFEFMENDCIVGILQKSRRKTTYTQHSYCKMGMKKNIYEKMQYKKKQTKSLHSDWMKFQSSKNYINQELKENPEKRDINISIAMYWLKQKHMRKQDKQHKRNEASERRKKCKHSIMRHFHNNTAAHISVFIHFWKISTLLAFVTNHSQKKWTGLLCVSRRCLHLVQFRKHFSGFLVEAMTLTNFTREILIPFHVRFVRLTYWLITVMELMKFIPVT